MKLKAWQKYRQVKPGWTFIVGQGAGTGSNRLVNGYTSSQDINRVTLQHKATVKVAPGTVFNVSWINPRRGWIWLKRPGQTLVITLEDARRIGGVFTDRLQAEVAFRSGRLGDHQ